MRTFLEILRFEFRRQLKSPFFWGVLILFFLLHLFTITSVGIHLGENHRIDINGAAKVLQVLSAYTYLAMFPAAVFVIRALLYDFERSTASFFFVMPLAKLHFLAGRFASAFVPAFIVGCIGLLAVFLGPVMPWAEELPLGEFTATPYAFGLAVLVAPNAFILCALFFAVAALTRSAAMTVAAAAVLLAVDAALALYTQLDDGAWATIADPFGALAILVESRYWTVPELNNQLPGGLLLQNRLLWLAIAALALALAFWRFRLDLSQTARPRIFRLPRRRALNAAPKTVPPGLNVHPSFSFRGSLSQLASQFAMDARSLLKSPLFYVVLFGAILTVVAESGRHTSQLSNLPYYPYTRLMLEIFHYGISPLITLMVIYFSGALVHRENDSGIAEIVGASPYADWIMPLSKNLALWLAVGLVLLTTMLTAIALQAAAGFTHFELGLYLKSLFVYDGANYAMLCVLAVTIQALTPNKWLGMLLLFAAALIFASLPSLGAEHVLVGFSVPFAPLLRHERIRPCRPLGHLAHRVLGLLLRLIAGRRPSAVSPRPLSIIPPAHSKRPYPRAPRRRPCLHRRPHRMYRRRRLDLLQHKRTQSISLHQNPTATPCRI